MDRNRDPRGRYGGIAPYERPDRREMQRRAPPTFNRGRFPPPPDRVRREYLGRPLHGGRDRQEAIELPPSFSDRLKDPVWIGRMLPYAGIATIIVSLGFLLLYLVEIKDMILLVPVFAAGAIGMAITVIGSVLLLIKGDEESVNNAYLGLGLTIASFILMGAGAVLAWS